MIGKSKLEITECISMSSTSWQKDRSTVVNIVYLKKNRQANKRWVVNLGTKHCNDKQWASYQIRKIVGSACVGNAGNVFPAADFRRIPPDPGMHHGTCVMHVPWCMSGSLTLGGGENVPGIPGACATRNSRYLVRGSLQSLWHPCRLSVV